LAVKGFEVVVLLVTGRVVDRTSVGVEGRGIAHFDFVIRIWRVDIHGLGQGIEHALFHVRRE